MRIQDGAFILPLSPQNLDFQDEFQAQTQSIIDSSSAAINLSARDKFMNKRQHRKLKEFVKMELSKDPNRYAI